MSLMTARCVGACSRAPVVLCDGEVAGEMSREQMHRATGKVGRGMTIEELEQIAKSVQQENAKYDYEVNVCMDLACASQGAEQLREALVKAVEGVGQKGAGAPHRLHGPVLLRAAGARRSRGDTLPQGERRRTPRQSSPAWAANRCPSCSAT